MSSNSNMVSTVISYHGNIENVQELSFKQVSLCMLQLKKLKGEIIYRHG